MRILLGVLFVTQLIAFQNCGSDFVVRSGLGSASSSSICEAGLEAEFASSYHSLLKTKCASCHTGAGPGNGAFANSNSSVAFSAFLLAGSEKIDTYAQNASHASGYTGSQNASAVAIASQAWAASAASCRTGGVTGSGGAGSTSSYMLSAKTVPAAATATDVVWALDSEVTGVSLGSGGATLTVAVSRAMSPNGTAIYYISNPRLKGGSKAVQLEVMKPIFNRQVQTLSTTFSRVSGLAPAGQTVALSTATLIIEIPTASASDTLSFSIDTLAVAN